MKYFVSTVLSLTFLGCDIPDAQPQNQAASGAKRIIAKVQTDAEGLTVEQKNVRERLLADNTPGSIKHVYVISAYSGQVILYSTVRGKVTSSGKRLTPKTVAAGQHSLGQYNNKADYGIAVNIGGSSYMTSEVLQDDGTYGDSAEYLFWFDSAGRYHQHYVAGGQIVHVCDQPIRVKDIIINVETSQADLSKK